MLGLCCFGFHAVSMISAFKYSAVCRSFRDGSVEFQYICGSSPLFFPDVCINVDVRTAHFPGFLIFFAVIPSGFAIISKYVSLVLTKKRAASVKKTPGFGVIFS